MALAHGAWTLEEAFAGDSEKLGAVTGSVLVQQSRFALPGLALQPLKFRLRHAVPSPALLAVRDRRRAIHVAIQAIHVVGEFVDHQIAAGPQLFWIGDLCPRQYNRTPMPRLAQPWRGRTQYVMLLESAAVWHIA